MNCPTCGGPTRVVSTDKFDRFVVRIRKCTQCGASETTDEVPRRAPIAQYPKQPFSSYKAI